MIVYKTLEEVLADIQQYKHHRVVDDVRMTREVDIRPSLLSRLKCYVMGDPVQYSRVEGSCNVRITPTTLYAHPDIVDQLRAAVLATYD